MANKKVYTVDVTVMASCLGTFYNIEAEDAAEAEAIVRERVKNGEIPESLEVEQSPEISTPSVGNLIDNVNEE